MIRKRMVRIELRRRERLGVRKLVPCMAERIISLLSFWRSIATLVKVTKFLLGARSGARVGTFFEEVMSQIWRVLSVMIVLSWTRKMQTG